MEIMEMTIGKYTPLFVVTLNAEDADFCKQGAQRKYDEEKAWSREQDWQGGYLAEYAMRQYLKEHGKRYAAGRIYFGDAAEAPKDTILWRNGEQFTIGVRSRHHRTLERYPDKLVCFYPSRRFQDQDKIADFIVMTSVKSNSDGGSTIAFWGAIPKERLLRLWSDFPSYVHKRTLQEYKSIPLEEFDPQLLQDLLSSCDER